MDGMNESRVYDHQLGDKKNPRCWVQEVMWMVPIDVETLEKQGKDVPKGYKRTGFRQAQVLGILRGKIDGKQKAWTQAELADKLEVDGPQVNQVLRKMIKKGLVVRKLCTSEDGKDVFHYAALK